MSARRLPCHWYVAVSIITASALLAVSGCGGGGGSSGGAAAAPGAGSGTAGGGSTTGGGTGGGTTGGGSTGGGGPAALTPPGTATNQPQWQTALAALAAAPSPDPVRFEAASLAAYDDLIARAWPGIAPRVAAEIETSLQGAAGNALSGVAIASVGAVTVDVAAPPALAASAPAPRQTVEAFLPAPPQRWSVEVEVLLGGTIPLSIGGVSIPISISIPVTATASDVAVVAPVDMDLADPTRPRIASAGTPSVALRLTLASNAPELQQVSGLVTQLLDPIVRAALQVGAIVAQQQLGIALGQLPDERDWGRGGPPVAATPNAPALEPIADALAVAIDRDHTPHGNVYEAVFDQPHAGGSIVGFRHHGDAAIWTGSYLASLAYRYDVDGDPRALTAAARIISAFDKQTRLSPPPFDGLLARTAIPLSSPHAAALRGSQSYYEGTVNGVAYGALGDISRDQYTGVLFGLGQAWHRMPPLRSEITPIVERLIDQLDRHGWNAFKAPGQGNYPADPATALSVTFAQAPQAVLAFATVGRVVDPARWSALHARTAPLADMLWFNAWVSAGEVHESYYRYNLSHTNLLTLVELETDPDRYRAYLRLMRILRTTVGHHQNAWFDVIAAVADPSAGPTLGPRVQRELELWTLRPRRGFAVTNSADPSIAKATITATIPAWGGSPGGALTTAPRTREVAVLPLPIDRRTASDFVWQRSPFSLDGAKDPHEQPPGIDLVLPYWVGRNHGLLR